MTTHKKTYPTPFSLRLSEDKRAHLDDKVVTMPLSAYTRSLILENIT